MLAIDPNKHRSSGSKGIAYYAILIAVAVGVFVTTVGITGLANQLDINKLNDEIKALKNGIETYINNTDSDINVYFSNDDLDYIKDIEDVEAKFENMILIFDELNSIGTTHGVTYSYMEFDTVDNEVTFEITVATASLLTDYLRDLRDSQYFTGYNQDYSSVVEPISVRITAYYRESATRA